MILLTTLGNSCKEEVINSCRERTCITQFSSNQSIEVSSEQDRTQLEIVDGDYLVFHYLYTYDDKPGIADDELTENL